MKKMRKFLIYALIIIGFWLFSNLIIFIAVNGTERLVDVLRGESYHQVNVQNNNSVNIN